MARSVADVAADAREAANDASVRQRLATLATEAVGSSAADYGAWIAAERQRWGKLIKDLGIKAE